MTTPFYTGYFLVSTNQWVEWDGTNEDDIVELLNNFPMEQNRDTWTYDIIDGNLVFTGTPYAGPQQPAPVGSWMTILPGSGRNYMSFVPPEQQAQYWKTPDPTGRPTDLNDLLGSSPDADVE
jgi:hypothetical protein